MSALSTDYQFLLYTMRQAKLLNYCLDYVNETKLRTYKWLNGKVGEYNNACEDARNASASRAADEKIFLSVVENRKRMAKEAGTRTVKSDLVDDDIATARGNTPKLQSLQRLKLSQISSDLLASKSYARKLNGFE